MLAPDITSFDSDFPLYLHDDQIRTHNEVTSLGVRINMIMESTDRLGVGRRLVVPLNCSNPRVQDWYLSYYAVLIEVTSSTLLTEKTAMIQGYRIGELLVSGNNPEYWGKKRRGPPKIWRSMGRNGAVVDPKSLAKMQTVVTATNRYQRNTVYIDT